MRISMMQFGKSFSSSLVGLKMLSATIAGMAGLAWTASSQAVIVDVGAAPTLFDTWTIGQPSDVHADVVTAGAVYSDDTTFSGYAVYAGGTGTTKYTGMIADDINTTATSSFTLGQFSWSVANGATVAQTISPYIRFYDTTGAGGGPGNLLGGLNFNGISVAAGNVAGFYYNPYTQSSPPTVITLPTSFWAAEFFSTTGSNANAEKIGVGTFNPVDVGSSQDLDYTSTSVSTSSSSFTSADPAGTVHTSPFAGTPVANFEWEFNPVSVPEPTVLGVVAATCGLLLRRRRAMA